ncbi:MAG: GNAT family N-acetyltransferase [Actinomycetota bacterium]|nr:GNAT family N-acetyltransferase [Actinomycetota bacterium]
MRAEFIKPSDPRWLRVLECTRYDFYHLPGYVELAAEHEDGLPVAFYAEDGDAAMLIPLLIRKLPEHLNAPGDWFDVASPYGYPAPLLVGGGNPAQTSLFFEAFKAIGRDYGIVTAFIRLHPLIEFPRECLHDYGTLVLHGQTVYVDLSRPRETLWAEMRHNHRSNINRLRNLGFYAVFDEWSQLGAFFEMYRETMRRVSASTFYFFNDAYFEGLRSVLGERLHLCAIMSPEGEVAAAGLFSTVNGIVQGHLGAALNKYQPLAPSKFEIYAGIEWAMDTGNLLYHLGGGVGGSSDDSLFASKAGFSKTQAGFHTFRMVLDEARHELLLNRWRRLNCGDGQVDTGFFPEYRQKCA